MVFLLYPNSISMYHVSLVTPTNHPLNPKMVRVHPLPQYQHGPPSIQSIRVGTSRAQLARWGSHERPGLSWLLSPQYCIPPIAETLVEYWIDSCRVSHKHSGDGTNYQKYPTIVKICGPVGLEFLNFEPHPQSAEGKGPCRTQVERESRRWSRGMFFCQSNAAGTDKYILGESSVVPSSANIQ